MAKRITTDAKIVLERAGYVVEYVYNGGAVSALKVWAKPFEFVARLPIFDKCFIDNALIEELIAKKG